MLKSCRHILFSGLFAFLFLVLFKTGLLYHLEQYSLFCPKGEYLRSFFEQPGGVLALVGAFLTQFCHFPVLGAALFALCLCLQTWLTGKAFGLEGKAAWLATLPALFLLLFVTRLDYSIYLFKTYGLLFSQVLGYTVAAGLVLVYRKCFLGRRYSPMFPALVLLAGYPLFGSFSLIAAVLMALTALREGKLGLIELAVTLILGAAVPWLCRELPWVFPRIHRNFVYFAGFPYKEFVENGICQVPLILAFAAMAALCFLRKARGFAVPALVLAAVLAVGAGSNWDSGFRTVLGMERAVSQQDWDQVLKLAKKERTPNRIHVLYRNIALYGKGTLTEEMFRYPDGDAPLRSKAVFPISYICAAPVLYYCGMPNPCDRLAMEYSSTFCKNIHFYKYQAKTALLSGEYDLARKYLDMVDANWFQGKWVRRYRAFLDNPGYVNESVFEWQAACYLTRKDAERTLYCVFNRHELLPDAPVGTALAEGAALFASQSGDLDMMRELVGVLSSRQQVLRTFSQFSNALNAAGDLRSEKTKERFQARYEGTYWYYYYFMDINTKR